MTWLEGLVMVALGFSPKGTADDVVIDAIGMAKKELHVAAYSFTHPKIADALIAAKKRGVEVWVLLDCDQKTARGSQAKRLAEGGIPIRYDCKEALMHNKYMVIDRKLVETGSFNYTNAAEVSNAENAIVLKAPALAAQFLQNWGTHWTHGEAQ